MDEIDWCLRAAAKGLRIVYNPEAEVEAPRFPGTAFGTRAGAVAMAASYGLPAQDPYLGRGLRLRWSLGREWPVFSMQNWNEGARIVAWRDGVPAAI